MGCFWTSFEETYEICGGGPVEETTFWPVNAQDYTVWSQEEYGVTIYYANTVGDPLFPAPDLEIGGDWEEFQFPRGTINWEELPVTEAWKYNSNGFGDYPKGQFIVQTAGLAALASISAVHVSGEVRTFSIDDTFQNFALLGLSYDDPPDYQNRDSVYDITVEGVTLRLHIRSMYMAH